MNDDLAEKRKVGKFVGNKDRESSYAMAASICWDVGNRVRW